MQVATLTHCVFFIAQQWGFHLIPCLYCRSVLQVTHNCHNSHRRHIQRRLQLQRQTCGRPQASSASIGGRPSS